MVDLKATKPTNLPEDDAMAHYQITRDAQTIQALVEQKDQALAQLLQQVLNPVLDAEVTEYLQADRYERTEGRQGYRNGYRSRQLTTRVGTLTLDVPRTRDGEFSPALFDRYQRHEKALVLTLMEMVVNGCPPAKSDGSPKSSVARNFLSPPYPSWRKVSTRP
ncbi:transposase mutator type [Sulfobacillus acidophilus TPY]|nr:transposase mutator type [Sulfobacillus acidophilus TPY]